MTQGSVYKGATLLRATFPIIRRVHVESGFINNLQDSTWVVVRTRWQKHTSLWQWTWTCIPRALTPHVSVAPVCFLEGLHPQPVSGEGKYIFSFSWYLAYWLVHSFTRCSSLSESLSQGWLKVWKLCGWSSAAWRWLKWVIIWWDSNLCLRRFTGSRYFINFTFLYFCSNLSSLPSYIFHFQHNIFHSYIWFTIFSSSALFFYFIIIIFCSTYFVCQ